MDRHKPLQQTGPGALFDLLGIFNAHSTIYPFSRPTFFLLLPELHTLIDFCGFTSWENSGSSAHPESQMSANQHTV